MTKVLRRNRSGLILDFILLLMVLSFAAGCKKSSPTSVETSAPTTAGWVQISDLYGSGVNCFGVIGTHILAATSAGVYLSTDNGLSWGWGSLPDPSVICFAAADSLVYAGTGDAGLFVSSDKGYHWELVHFWWVETAEGGLALPVAAVAFSGTNLLAAVSDDIYFSTPGDSLWTSEHTPIPGVVQSFAVAGSKVFAAMNSEIYVSTDRGMSWTGIAQLNLDVHTLIASGPRLLAGTAGGVLVSDDNGESWTAANSGLTDTLVYSLTFSGNRLFAGTSNGVFASPDSALSWTPLKGLPNSATVIALMASSSNLLAGTTKYGAWRIPL